MHLVFLNQYYPPDAAPTGVMLEAVAEECARQGHQVTVICAAGGYAGGAKLKTETLKAETGGLRSGGGNIEHRTSDVEHRGVGRDRRLARHSLGDDGARPLVASGAEGEGEVREEDGSSGVSATVAGRSSTLSSQKSKIHNQQSSISSSPDPRPPTPDPSSIRILRLPATRFGRGTFVGKLADYASYYLGVAWRLGTMGPPPDRIVALTTPPYLSVLARAVSKLRGADHAHWVMDLYPDVMVAHGMLAEGGWKHRLLAGIARWGFGGRRCVSVLALGPDMAERVWRHCEESTAKAQRPLRDAEERGAETRPTTDNRQLPPVSWVPLWGGTNIEHRTSDIEHRREEAPADFPNNQQSTINNQQSSISSSSPNSQPSTLNPQLSTSSLRAKRGWAEGEFVVMYSGNMGLGHRFGEILEVAVGLDCQAGPLVASGVGGGGDAEENPLGASQSRSAPVGTSGRAPAVTPYPGRLRFVFYGGGKRRGEIEAFIAAHPEVPVELHDYAPAEELTAHLTSADVHLVSLEPEWTGTMVPSKLQGIFAVGRPVVFVGSRESSIGRWVEESGGGWVVAPGDVAGLRVVLEEARDQQTRKARGEAAGAFARQHFDKVTNVARVAEIFTR